LDDAIGDDHRADAPETNHHISSERNNSENFMQGFYATLAQEKMPNSTIAVLPFSAY
jgi:hypothetical protein